MNEPFAAHGAISQAGEEDLRFIRNFHDIFLSIGILMFAAGLALATSIALGPMLIKVADAGGEGWRGSLAIVSAASAANAVVMWLMAEYFARGRRLFLPSIVIYLAYVGFFFVAAAAAYGAVFNFDREMFRAAGPDARIDSAAFVPLIRQGSEAAIVVYGATLLASFAFYARMKLPFAMGLTALQFTGVAVATAIYFQPERMLNLLDRAQLYSGLFLFLLGVIYDARDPERRGRISDNAFWLHFFAAPVILNSAIGMAVGFEGAAGDPVAAALTTLAIVGGFALVSLLINRRALLVAGLLYALIAAGFLISKVGLSEAWTAAVTLLVLGAGVVLLGAGWHAMRRVIVAPFPKRGLIARIIPPEPPRAEIASDE